MFRTEELCENGGLNEKKSFLSERRLCYMRLFLYKCA